MDRTTGDVVMNSLRRQGRGGQLVAGTDNRFAAVVSAGGKGGTADAGEMRASYRRVQRSTTNANDWYVVVMSKPATATLLSGAAIPFAVMAAMLSWVVYLCAVRRRAAAGAVAHAAALLVAGLDADVRGALRRRHPPPLTHTEFCSIQRSISATGARRRLPRRTMPRKRTMPGCWLVSHLKTCEYWAYCNALRFVIFLHP